MSTLNALPLLDIVPNFDQKIGFKYVSQYIPIEGGIRETLFPDLKAQAAMNFTYLTRAKADSLALVTFWESMQGAKTSFWCPSWKNQLGVQGNPRAGDGTLKITSVGTGYGNVFLSGPNTTYASGAFIFLYDFINPPQFHQVTAVSTAAGIDTLTLGTNLAINFTARRFICGLVYLVRFGDDKLEETWMDENCLEAKLGFVETINFRPDPEPNGFAPVVTPATVNVPEGSAFDYTIVATNTPTSYFADDLPAGLTLNDATGEITGTITSTALVTYNCVVYALNKFGVGQAALTIVVVNNYFVACGGSYTEPASTGVPYSNSGNNMTGFTKIFGPDTLTSGGGTLNIPAMGFSGGTLYTLPVVVSGDFTAQFEVNPNNDRARGIGFSFSEVGNHKSVSFQAHSAYPGDHGESLTSYCDLAGAGSGSGTTVADSQVTLLNYNAWNTIKVARVGSTWTFTVNGIDCLVETIHPENAKVGLLWGFDSVTVNIRNISIT